MADDRQAHWDRVYTDKAADTVSWYQPRPEPSLRSLDQAGVPNTASLVDIGGGASSLVDCLLARGGRDLAVLDIAAPALAVAKARLGADAAKVRWVVADITAWRPDRTFDVWHDRAVFHFLTEPAQRAAYLRALREGLAPEGLVILATFAPDGPERCSGLPVRRYDAATLAQELGPEFRLLDYWNERHRTPGGAEQSFTWCLFRRTA